MQRIAYGHLGLQPHEFWALTPKEYYLMSEGFKRVDDANWQKIAQLASWVTAPHLKNPIHPSKLLDPKGEGRKSKNKTTPEETKNVLAELESEIKVI